MSNTYKRLLSDRAEPSEEAKERMRRRSAELAAKREADESRREAARKAGLPASLAIPEVMAHMEAWEGKPDSVWTRDHIQAVFDLWLTGDREPLSMLALANSLGQRLMSVLFYLKQFDFQNGEGRTWSSQLVVREIFARGDAGKLAELNARFRAEYDSYHGNKEAS